MSTSEEPLFPFVRKMSALDNPSGPSTSEEPLFPFVRKMSALDNPSGPFPLTADVLYGQPLMMFCLLFPFERFFLNACSAHHSTRKHHYTAQ